MQTSEQKKAEKKHKKSTFRRRCFCAQDETRTHTTLLPLPPQSSVYTNFTTCAFRNLIAICLRSLHSLCPEQDSNLHTSRHTHLKRTRLPIPPPGLRRKWLVSWLATMSRFGGSHFLLFDFEKTSFSHRGWDLENKCRNKSCNIFTERWTRLELATPTLARSCSTNWAIIANVLEHRSVFQNRLQKYCFFLNWQNF